MSALVDLLASAGQDDLKEIEAAIEAAERELSSLRAARKVIQLKLGLIFDKQDNFRKKVQQQRDKAVSGVEVASLSETSLISKRRQEIYQYLAVNRNVSQQKLCEVFDIPMGSITATLNHQWFKKAKNGGVELA